MTLAGSLLKTCDGLMTLLLLVLLAYFRPSLSSVDVSRLISLQGFGNGLFLEDFVVHITQCSVLITPTLLIEGLSCGSDHLD